jgi:hypothetical protein
MTMPLSRRDFLRSALAAGVLALPFPLAACARPPAPGDDPDLAGDTARGRVTDPPSAEDAARLAAWVAAVRAAGLDRADVPFGRAVVGVGEQAIGTPYVAYTLEEYLKAGGSPARAEPLTLSLTRFDCVTLVESCLALARLSAEGGAPTWDGFGREMERMRYRGGQREGYASRLHYFSEWIADGERRGLVRDLGAELGGVADERPLRFMTGHRDSYPALADDGVFAEIGRMERSLDGTARHVIPTGRIDAVSDRIETGDVLAFATSIEGLDVTHAALAYRDEAGVLRVLHAPLSGGVVEITRSTLPEYVRAIRRSTGILVARPLRAV